MGLWVGDPFSGFGHEPLVDTFAGAIDPLLSSTGYSSVQIEMVSSYAELEQSLKSSRYDVVECDPGFIFGAVDPTLPTNLDENLLYLPVLQRVYSGDEGLFASVYTRRESGIVVIDALEGHTVAAAHPLSLSGGLTQLMQFRNLGLDPLVDIEIQYCGSASEAFKLLASGWVEAALVPEGSHKRVLTDAGLPESTLEKFSEIARLGPVLGNVFLFKRTFVDEYPILEAGVRNFLIQVMGRGSVVPAKRDYYVSIREHLQALGQLGE